MRCRKRALKCGVSTEERQKGEKMEEMDEEVQAWMAGGTVGLYVVMGLSVVSGLVGAACSLVSVRKFVSGVLGLVEESLGLGQLGSDALGRLPADALIAFLARAEQGITPTSKEPVPTAPTQPQVSDDPPAAQDQPAPEPAQPPAPAPTTPEASPAEPKDDGFEPLPTGVKVVTRVKKKKKKTRVHPKNPQYVTLQGILDDDVWGPDEVFDEYGDQPVQFKPKATKASGTGAPPPSDPPKPQPTPASSPPPPPTADAPAPTTPSTPTTKKTPKPKPVEDKPKPKSPETSLSRSPNRSVKSKTSCLDDSTSNNEGDSTS